MEVYIYIYIDNSIGTTVLVHILLIILFLFIPLEKFLLISVIFISNFHKYGPKSFRSDKLENIVFCCF